MKLNNLTRSALSLSIIFVCFLIFKGPTNILNALFIPLTIVIFTYSNNNKESMIFYLATILFCLLFFNIQIFFIIMYCIIANSLIFFLKNNIKAFLVFPILTLIIALCFWLGIFLTDAIFHMQINHIMMKILNNNLIYYLSMIIIESGIVSFLLYSSSKFFIKRIA